MAYISECPGIISSIEVEDDKLKKLNDELIKIYNDQIDVLTRYSTIVYKYNGRDLTDKEIDDAYNELINLNKDNIQLYNRFIEWNNRLRE